MTILLLVANIADNKNMKDITSTLILVQTCIILHLLVTFLKTQVLR